MNAREWIEAFATELGAEPPTNEEMTKLLDLAAVAAHSSERIACWIGGTTGATIQELQAAAERVDGDSQASDST